MAHAHVYATVCSDESIVEHSIPTLFTEHCTDESELDIGWSATLVLLDNQGMCSLRSAIWDQQHLGQQLYLRVSTPQ
jgi:hypothetical protein